MSASCFYKARVEGYQPVSFLMLEVISDLFEKDPDTPLESLLQTACSLCHGESHGIDLAALAVDLQEIMKDREGDSPPPSTKKSLGTAYMKWLAATTPTQLCLMLSSWDIAKARVMYCENDHRDVKDMSEIFLELQWNKIQAAYECSMYGFGGGYKGDSGGDTKDLTQNNPAAEQLIKTLGF